MDNQPPALASVWPPAGAAGDLTALVVTFTEPVAGVDEEDLLMNSVPAERVYGAGTTYTFTFRSPPYGAVSMRWAAGHGIADFAVPPNPFRANGRSRRDVHLRGCETARDRRRVADEQPRSPAHPDRVAIHRTRHGPRRADLLLVDGKQSRCSP